MKLTDIHKVENLNNISINVYGLEFNRETKRNSVVGPLSIKSGNFRRVAHELCTKKFRAPNFVPVFLHNLSHYDSHFKVHALNFVEGQVDLIPQNEERYISFTKTLYINNQTFKLRFVESLKFLPSSLNQLTKNHKYEQLHTLRTKFPNNEDFVRLKKEGVYPYEFMSSNESLKLTSLPSQQHFYSTLTDSKVSDDDYHHAQDVWDHFQCLNMLD
ncbi:unnamed protein product [Euphydryas editha]|uniref:Uncharacterized protein n=1 Tax=Euphydryas editha TaxID=104508 RepID=A0AAU9UYC6_EUPED|nr:unnamed protein product [Euphydryas editha]